MQLQLREHGQPGLCHTRHISQDTRSFHFGQPRNVAGCLHPRRPQTGCHVIYMVLCTRRSTRCGVVFLLSHDLSQVGSRSLWSRSWQTLCRRSWTVCSMCHGVVDVPVPQILEEIVELVAGEVVCNARTGVRLQHGWTCPQPSSSLCSRSWWLERGPYSCLAMMKMKVKHIHTCHSHCISEARARANGDKRATSMETPLQSSVLSFGRCRCRQVVLVKPKRAYHQPSRELWSWVVDYALLTNEGREPRDACDVLIPILREKCGRVERPRNVA